jgi:hypothetical protein
MSILKDILIGMKAKKPAVKRSSRWPAVRDAYLTSHPACACCGETKKVEVHHIMPFSNDPSLELDPNNLITLCEVASNGIICHICVGHGGNYRYYNPNVKLDAKRIYDMIHNRVD